MSSAPCTALPGRGKSSFTLQRCLLGIFLATLAFLLFTLSGKSLKRLRTRQRGWSLVWGPRVWVDLRLTEVGVEDAARVFLGVVR